MNGGLKNSPIISSCLPLMPIFANHDCFCANSLGCFCRRVVLRMRTHARSCSQLLMTTRKPIDFSVHAASLFVKGWEWRQETICLINLRTMSITRKATPYNDVGGCAITWVERSFSKEKEHNYALFYSSLLVAFNYLIKTIARYQFFFRFLPSVFSLHIQESKYRFSKTEDARWVLV